MNGNDPIGNLYVSVYSPFAQRVLAVADRLNIKLERDEIDLDNKPDDFLRRSPTGEVPLFYTEDRLLYGSDVIAGWLAERAGWEKAWPGDPYWAWRQRLVVQQWDRVIVPLFRTGLEDNRELMENRDSFLGELDWFEDLIRRSAPPTDSMLGLCVGPFWQRFRWYEQEIRFSDWLKGYDVLVSWLDDLLDHESLKRTAPDRYLTVRRFKEEWGFDER